MLPSIFGESLFDDFFDFPFERASRGHDPLYGKHGKNLMKTDIKEKENSYEVDIDLPGFKKEDIKIHLEDGFLTVSAQKALDQGRKGSGWPLHQTGTVLRPVLEEFLCRRKRHGKRNLRKTGGWYFKALRPEEGCEKASRKEIYCNRVIRSGIVRRNTGARETAACQEKASRGFFILQASCHSRAP